MGRHNRAHHVDGHKDGFLTSGALPVEDASASDTSVSTADGSIADGSMTGPDGGFSEPAQGITNEPTQQTDDAPGLSASEMAAHANSRATAFIAAHPIVTVVGAITAGFVIGRILSRA